jgi:hypothetical protein
MDRIFGNYIEVEHTPKEYLEIQISMSSASKRFDWQKNSICAEFVANYMSRLVFNDNEDGSLPHRGMADAINYIANELFENSTKFNEPASNKVLSFQANRVDRALRFYIRNSIDRNAVASFHKLIEKLLTEDPEQLYIERMERGAEGADQSAGLGYLSMIVDYGAKVGWKFESAQARPDSIFVTTMIMIDT